MEPISLAASLVTLLVLVRDSAQKMNNMRIEFRDSRRSLKRLETVVAENQKLLQEISAISEAYERVGISQSLVTDWKSMYDIVTDNFKALQSEVTKILDCSSGKEITKKHIRQRINQFFSEDNLERYYQQLSRHKTDIDYIHLLMQRYDIIYTASCLFLLMLSQFIHNDDGTEPPGRQPETRRAKARTRHTIGNNA